MLGIRFQLWQPGNLLRTFDCNPLVDSWERKDSSSQVRLQKYLDSVALALEPLPERALLYIALDVSVKEPGQLLRHYDLENYLTPVARRLGHQRFTHAMARKTIAGVSEIRSGYAATLDMDLTGHGWNHFACSAGSGPDTKRWKAALRDRLAAAGAETMPDGPVAVHLAWRCSSARNWVALWKPTGDAMGPVLGEPDPRNPFNPADDRITELHFHVTRDDSLGHDVDVGMWWTAASR